MSFIGYFMCFVGYKRDTDVLYVECKEKKIQIGNNFFSFLSFEINLKG